MLFPRAFGTYRRWRRASIVAFTATRWGTLLEPYADWPGPPPTAWVTFAQGGVSVSSTVTFAPIGCAFVRQNAGTE